MTEKSKIVQLKKVETNSNKMTWGLALQEFLDEADEETKSMPVLNMIVIAEHSSLNHSFGLMSGHEVKRLLGTLECVKQYLVDIIHSGGTHE